MIHIINSAGKINISRFEKEIYEEKHKLELCQVGDDEKIPQIARYLN